MRKHSHAFANPIMICLIVAILFLGSVGLAMVWLRHRNSTLAKSNSELVARIAAVERRSDEMAALVQGEMRPDLLRQLNDRMRLGLVPLNEVPVVHVTENVAESMAERASRGFLRDTAAPARVTFAVR